MFDDSIRLARAAVALQPARADLFFSLGIHLRANKVHIGAATALQRAVQLDTTGHTLRSAQDYYGRAIYLYLAEAMVAAGNVSKMPEFYGLGSEVQRSLRSTLASHTRHTAVSSQLWPATVTNIAF